MNTELTYIDLKDRIKNGLNRIAEDFVEIGYNLKQIRDRRLYIEDGYDSINEFAQKEYGLSQSNTSRFIAINENYSIDGNSPKLLPEFEGYGSSKLSEMLSLSPEEMQLVSIRTTVAEIRTIKEAKKEAQQDEYSDNYATSHITETPENTQSEVNFEHKENEAFLERKKLIIEFFRDKTRREVLVELGKVLREGADQSITEIVSEIINPSGHLMFRKGIHIFVFETEIIKHNKFATGGVKEITYMDFLTDIAYTFDMTLDDPWVAFYGEPEPEPEPEPKKEIKQESQKAAEVKKEKKPIEPGPEEDLDKDDKEEQLPGQANIEDYPEIMESEDQEDTEVVEADIVETLKPSIAADECRHCKQIDPVPLHTHEYQLFIRHDGFIEIQSEKHIPAGQIEEVPIRECPMCGRRLKEVSKQI